MNAEEQIHQILNRDPDALDWLVDVFYQKGKLVYKKNQLYKSNFWELTDLVNSSFEYFWKFLRRDTRAEISNLEGFIFKIIYNQSFNMLRSSERASPKMTEKKEEESKMDQSYEDQMIEREKLQGRAKLFWESLKKMAEQGHNLCVRILTLKFDRKISDADAEKQLKIEPGKLRFKRRDCKNKLNNLMRKSPDFQSFTS